MSSVLGSIRAGAITLANAISLDEATYQADTPLTDEIILRAARAGYEDLEVVITVAVSVGVSVAGENAALTVLGQTLSGDFSFQRDDSVPADPIIMVAVPTSALSWETVAQHS